MSMVASVTSAANAAGYYESGQDDGYYAAESTESAWLGQGAATLGIDGQAVEQAQFRSLLEGDVGGAQVGTWGSDGQWHHHPGWDIQFSPDKSVSVAGLVHGDQSVLDAHDQAVRKAVEHLEQKAAVARYHVRDQAGERWEHERTGNLVVAAHRHETSRALDPQLHTHAVVHNLTQRSDGKWVSLDSRELHRLQQEASLVYKAELASGLRQQGYALEPNGPKDFRLQSVPAEVTAEFSQRKDAIDRALERQGLSRETASAEYINQVSRETRASKGKVDRAGVYQEWRDREAAIHRGLQAEGRGDADPQPGNLGAAGFATSSIREMQNSAEVEAADAQKVVAAAVRHLSERVLRFTTEELQEAALVRAQRSGVSPDAVTSAISADIYDSRNTNGTLYERDVLRWDFDSNSVQAFPGYTTEGGVRAEQEILDHIQRGQDRFAAVASGDEADAVIRQAERTSEHPWNDDQKSAAKGLLESTDRVVGLQGLAGTAKTSTVLKTLSNELTKSGYNVIGMAPSSTAATELGKGAEIDQAKTLEKHLLSLKTPGAEDKPQAWIVDEAGMVSVRDMNRLMKAAEEAGARVYLSGDREQLGSVESGAAWRMLQEAGMHTEDLSTILRQSNPDAHAAVTHSVAREFEEAMERIHAAGGVIERSQSEDEDETHDAAQEDRWASVAAAYLAQSPEARANTVIIEPSNAGRHEINERIRDGLKEEGRLTGEAPATVLDKKELTRQQGEESANYNAGEYVRFQKAYVKYDIAKGEVFRIDSKAADGTLTLRNDRTSFDWNPETAKWGSKNQVLEERNTEIAVGDPIRFTQNNDDHGWKNGEKGEMVDIQDRLATIESEKGFYTIDLDKWSEKAWDHRYAETVQKVQGSTAKHVIAHLESQRINLVNQKSLYTAISRPKESTTVVTDNKGDLIENIRQRTGEKETAMEEQQFSRSETKGDEGEAGKREGYSANSDQTPSLSNPHGDQEGGVKMADENNTMAGERTDLDHSAEAGEVGQDPLDMNYGTPDATDSAYILGEMKDLAEASEMKAQKLQEASDQGGKGSDRAPETEREAELQEKAKEWESSLKALPRQMDAYKGDIATQLIGGAIDYAVITIMKGFRESQLKDKQNEEKNEAVTHWQVAKNLRAATSRLDQGEDPRKVYQEQANAIRLAAEGTTYRNAEEVRLDKNGEITLKQPFQAGIAADRVMASLAGKVQESFSSFVDDVKEKAGLNPETKNEEMNQAIVHQQVDNNLNEFNRRFGQETDTQKALFEKARAVELGSQGQTYKGGPQAQVDSQGNIQSKEQRSLGEAVGAGVYSTLKPVMSGSLMLAKAASQLKELGPQAGNEARADSAQSGSAETASTEGTDGGPTTEGGKESETDPTEGGEQVESAGAGEGAEAEQSDEGTKAESETAEGTEADQAPQGDQAESESAESEEGEQSPEGGEAESGPAETDHAPEGDEAESETDEGVEPDQSAEGDEGAESETAEGTEESGSEIAEGTEADQDPESDQSESETAESEEGEQSPEGGEAESGPAETDHAPEGDEAESETDEGVEPDQSAEGDEDPESEESAEVDKASEGDEAESETDEGVEPDQSPEGGEGAESETAEGTEESGSEIAEDTEADQDPESDQSESDTAESEEGEQSPEGGEAEPKVAEDAEADQAVEGDEEAESEAAEGAEAEQGVEGDEAESEVTEGAEAAETPEGDEAEPKVAEDAEVEQTGESAEDAESKAAESTEVETDVESESAQDAEPNEVATSEAGDDPGLGEAADGYPDEAEEPETEEASGTDIGNDSMIDSSPVTEDEHEARENIELGESGKLVSDQNGESPKEENLQQEHDKSAENDSELRQGGETAEEDVAPEM